MYFIIRMTSNTRHLTNDCARTCCGIECGRGTGFNPPMRITAPEPLSRIVIDEPNVCLPCCSAAGFPDPTPAVPFVSMDHIEFIARVLCRAEGENPNVMVAAFNNPDRQLGGGDVFIGDQHEQWREYATMARRFIISFRAIQGML